VRVFIIFATKVRGKSTFSLSRARPEIRKVVLGTDLFSATPLTSFQIEFRIGLTEASGIAAVVSGEERGREKLKKRDVDTRDAKKPNHKRNLIMIVAIGFLGYVALNVFGAVECLSQDGDVQVSNLSVRCFQDYGDWRPAL
jgi:hypothetical protein